MTPIKTLFAGTAEMLVPPTEITGVREKREITGAVMTTPESATTVIFESTATAPAESGPASTLTSISVSLRYSDSNNTSRIPCDCKVTIG